MKRYHVISIAILSGLIMGLSFGAKANPIPANAEYICGNTGITATIETNANAELQAGRIVHQSFLSLTDEASNVIYSGSVNLTSLKDGPYGIVYGSDTGTFYQIFSDGPKAIKVYQAVIKDNAIQSVQNTGLFCSR
ncbi:hypothetical protein BSY48_004434 [Salmonella enterica subsp. enterica serovar Agbeni]|nr:hypothetical protein [Salmonella enterica subsp. enterica serovar Agbeni]